MVGRPGQVGRSSARESLALVIVYLYIYITDHIAVELYIHEEVQSLTLHFPTEFKCGTDPGSHCFHDNGLDDARNNPGRTANKLHSEFSQKTGKDSLDELMIAQSLGARTRTHGGFQARNTEVAKSDYLLAFTWAEGTEPKKGGGTHNTWEKCRGRRLHIPLSSLVPPEGQSYVQRKGKSSHVCPRKNRTAREPLECSKPPPRKKPCLHFSNSKV